MQAFTIAVDLAKNVFEIAVADRSGKVIERRRLSRSQFRRYFENRPVAHVVMEACGTSHYWGRWLRQFGFQVSLLPTQYVRAYVRRNKTDRADATAILEASRATDIRAVPVKSVEQQAIQGLHRIRSGWLATKTMRINALRGLCREFGIIAPLRPRVGLPSLVEQLNDERCEIPQVLRTTLQEMLAEIRSLDERMRVLEAELARHVGRGDVCQRLMKIPGVGLLTATALVGSVGDIRGFRSPRTFASWLGLTPREFSSGNIRRLGSISKRGDSYLRTLLVHGARAVLYSADMARRAGRPLDALRLWGIEVRERVGHNKAAVAIANKLARIVWASWYRERDYEFRGPRLSVA